MASERNVRATTVTVLRATCARAKHRELAKGDRDASDESWRGMNPTARAEA
jgi:hypothetical protein